MHMCSCCHYGMLEQAILKAQTKSVAMLECTPINLALFCLQTTSISFASYSRLYDWVDRSWTPASFVVQRVGDVDGAKKNCGVPNLGDLICSCWLAQQHGTLSSHFSCCSCSRKLLMPRGL